MTQLDASQRYIVKGSVQNTTDPDWGTASDIASCVKSVDGVLWECTSPGVEIVWNAKGASHAARDGKLCIVWGSPRCSQSQSTLVASPATAHQLLDRLANSGATALGDIKGGFGIVFIDGEAKRLILAVDRFSIETICYGVDRDRLVFSDRADAVTLQCRTISRQSLYDYLYFHFIPGPATVFGEVCRIEHGSHVFIDHGQLIKDFHWKPRFEPSRALPVEDLCKQFRDLIRDIVAVEANRDEQLGCFLSGGTDSSTIVGMLGAVTGEKVRTYSIGFDASGYDEMEYARIAARHFGTDHHEYYLTADDLVVRIPEVAAYFDQPFGNSSVAPAYFCAQMARDDGVSRMLAGDGGDELFGGNTRYSLQKLLDLYERVPVWVRDWLVEPSLTNAGLVNRVPGLKHAAGYVRHARKPMPDRMESFNLLHRMGSDRILNAEWLSTIDTSAPLQAQRDLYARTPTGSVINRILQYDWKFTLADCDLPKVRGAIALTGMTVAYPLLADEIADFSLRIPADFKVRNFKLRWFFKHALREFLPDTILRKKKHGFGLPFGPWVVQHSELRNLAGDSLNALERRAILRPGFRDELLGKLVPEHPSYYGELLWILMMLEQWFAAHGEGPQLSQGVGPTDGAARAQTA